MKCPYEDQQGHSTGLVCIELRTLHVDRAPQPHRKLVQTEYQCPRCGCQFIVETICHITQPRPRSPEMPGTPRRDDYQVGDVVRTWPLPPEFRGSPLEISAIDGEVATLVSPRGDSLRAPLSTLRPGMWPTPSTRQCRECSGTGSYVGFLMMGPCSLCNGRGWVPYNPDSAPPGTTPWPCVGRTEP